jgi:hypothetical protein
MRAELEIALQWVAKAHNDFDMPTIEDAREARQCAERVLTWLQTAYPDLTKDG